jgi:beta-lactamase regulating signal transducer with metallopeptidase domain/HEAT repeat protein
MTTRLADLAWDLASGPGILPLLVLLLKITALLLIARLATLALGRASAGTRHLIWLVAVGAALALPALTLWSPLRLPVLPAPTVQAAAATPDATEPADRDFASDVAALTPDRDVDPRTSEAALPARAPAEGFTLPGGGTLLIIIWAVVAAGLLARLAHGAWAVRRIVRRATPLESAAWQDPMYEIADRIGLEQAPRLVRSSEVQMPFAAGVAAPVVVLPAESDGWSAERRTAVLIHELAHIRRRDLVGHTLGRIACALYWFHPLVWTAARRLRAESECACDDLALTLGTRPSEYAEHLLDIVTAVRNTATPAIALAMAHKKEFEGRMLAILNPALERRGPSRRESVSMVGALAGLALLVGAAAPVPREPAPVPTVLTATPNEMVALQDTQPQVPAPLPSPKPKPTPKPTPNPATAPVTPVSPTVPNPVTSPATPRPATPANPAFPVAPGKGGEDDPQRVAALARLLREDASAEVRRVSAWGLARFAREEAATQALVAALTGDKDPAVREMSAWALAGARRNPLAGPALVRAIKEDKDPSVRRTALWAAGSMHESGALDAMIGAIRDPNPELRELAIWGIGNLHPDRAPAPLVAALGDSSNEVRNVTAWALFVIRDPETADELEAAFRKETDPEVREGLLKALARMGERAVPILEQLLRSDDENVRRTAVTALAGGDAGGPWPWPWPEPRPYP